VLNVSQDECTASLVSDSCRSDSRALELAADSSMDAETDAL
jgi:hypothetical protein